MDTVAFGVYSALYLAVSVIVEAVSRFTLKSTLVCAD